MSQRIRTFLQKVRIATNVMLGGTNVIQASTFELQYPVLTPLKVIYDKVSKSTNYKQTYRLLTEVDPELSGAIDRIAKMVRGSYQGFGVRVGTELSNPESELIEYLEDFEKEFRIKDHFYAIADTMLTYGDSLYRVKFEDDVGLAEFRSLPMEFMTAVETEDQASNVSAQVFEANYYILNEGTSGEAAAKEEIWDKEEILQFPLNNISTTVYDLILHFMFLETISQPK